MGLLDVEARSLYRVRSGGHFSEIGYGVIYNRLNHYLNGEPSGLGSSTVGSTTKKTTNESTPGDPTLAGFHSSRREQRAVSWPVQCYENVQRPTSGNHAAVDLRPERVVRCGMIDWKPDYSDDSPAAPGTQSVIPPLIARNSFFRSKCRCTDPRRPL